MSAFRTASSGSPIHLNPRADHKEQTPMSKMTEAERAEDERRFRAPKHDNSPEAEAERRFRRDAAIAHLAGEQREAAGKLWDQRESERAAAKAREARKVR